MDVYFDQYRRQAFIYLLAFIFLGGLYFFILNAYFRNDYTLASIDFGASFLSICLFLLVLNKKINKGINYVIRFYLFFFYAAILLTLQFVESKSITIYTWVFLVPPLSYMLLGSAWGGLFTALFVLIESGIFYLHFWQPYSLDSTSKLSDIAFCLLVVWALTHLYEKAHRESQLKLVQLASKDPLTGLFNRTQMDTEYQNCLQESLEANLSLAVLLIDIDWFKKINDCYGHDMGDNALCQVANIIEKQINHQGKVFRLGGEEFCVYLPKTTRDNAYLVAEQVRTQVAQTGMVLDTESLFLTVSIGIVVDNKLSNTLDKQLRLADTAMYEAKKSGRNQIIFSKI